MMKRKQITHDRGLKNRACYQPMVDHISLPRVILIKLKLCTLRNIYICGEVAFSLFFSSSLFLPSYTSCFWSDIENRSGCATSAFLELDLVEWNLSIWYLLAPYFSTFVGPWTWDRSYMLKIGLFIASALVSEVGKIVLLTSFWSKALTLLWSFVPHPLSDLKLLFSLIMAMQSQVGTLMCSRSIQIHELTMSLLLLHCSK